MACSLPVPFLTVAIRLSTKDVVIGKSRCLEVRQLRSSLGDESTGNNISPFPIMLSAPINGRITSLTAFQLDSKPTSLLFLTTDQHQYAVIGYSSSCQPHGIQTYASGSLTDSWNILGQLSECGPLVTSTRIRVVWFYICTMDSLPSFLF